MIANERQYRITKAKLKEFEDALAELKSLSIPEDINEKLDFELDLGALSSQIEEFKEDLNEYDQLHQNRIDRLALNTFENLPQALVKARIARGLTQEKLAERLNVKPQQVQRDEANLYAGASFSKLLAVQKALNVEFKGEMTLPKMSD
ncbi:MAG: hypothetical protein RLZZ490_2491 [Cyanobacteriota bacterium]